MRKKTVHIQKVKNARNFINCARGGDITYRADRANINLAMLYVSMQ